MEVLQTSALPRGYVADDANNPLFFFNDTATTEIYTLSLHDALPISLRPNTKLVWMETPSNPLLKIVDLAAVAEITHEAGAVCVCDNTWAPIIQRPFEAGAD